MTASVPKRSNILQAALTRRWLGCSLAFAGLTGVCVLVGAVLLVFVAPRWFAPRSAQNPRVQIQRQSRQEPVTAGEPASLTITANESQSIVRYELSVDGGPPLVQMPAPGETTLPTITRMLWRPEKGPHVLVAKAIDVSGRVGISQPFVVDSVERPKDQPIGVSYEAKAGETLEQIAKLYGVSADQLRQGNPGLPASLMAGTEILMSIPRDQLPQGYFDGQEEEAPPPPGDMQFIGGGLPESPLPAPTELHAESDNGCGVTLTWTDNSTDETGFRIYRSIAGINWNPIYTARPNETRYSDRVSAEGDYAYYVAAVKDSEETASDYAWLNVPRESCNSEVLPSAKFMALQFEVLELTTPYHWDHAYCYLSLSLVETESHIPQDSDDYLIAEGSREGQVGWNIRNHAAGIRRYVFNQDLNEPVRVKITCGGTTEQDQRTQNLGTWVAEHPRGDWNGRDLFGDTDGFHVRYQIQSYRNEPPLASEAVDFGINPVAAIYMAPNPASCALHANLSGGTALNPIEGSVAALECLTMSDQMLMWDWTPNSPLPRSQLTGFRVYLNREYATDPREDDLQSWEELGATGSANQVLNVPRPSCGETYGFQVVAFMLSGTEFHSPRAHHTMSVSRTEGCPNKASVEVTLDTLEVHNIYDPCFLCNSSVLEAYGWGDFDILTAAAGPDRQEASVSFWGGRASEWEFGVGTLSGEQVPGTAISGPYRQYNGVNHLYNGDLVIGQGGHSTVGNRLRLTLEDGDTINFDFTLLDEDSSLGGDDVWCGTQPVAGLTAGWGETGEVKRFHIGPFTLEEWVSMNRDFPWDNSGLGYQRDDAHCTLTLHVRGLGRVR